MTARFLGIDQGTTGTKAVVLDSDGTVTPVYAGSHRQIHPAPGWVEHDAEELLDHVRQAITAAGPVDAIGLDNQGETVVGFDAETGKPIHNAIVWLDARTEPRIAALEAAGAGDDVRQRTGLPLDSYFSATKLAWLLENVPGAADLQRAGHLRLGTSDAFFLHRLTGRFATDLSTASRTSLMDLTDGRWDPELCRLFGVPADTLPEILPSAGGFGRLADGTPVTAALVDQQAALYGHGCREAGDLKFTFGTGGFALAVTGDAPVLDSASGLLPTIAWEIEGQRRYALDGGLYNAASALDWARAQGLFQDNAEIADFEGPSAIERGLVFVPALSGLACPHWDRAASGLFLGLGLETTRRDMVQAVLEGIALRAAEVLAAFDRLVPLKDTVSIDGGLTRNPYFRRMLARASGKRIRTIGAETAAIGSALLAAKGAGFGDIPVDLPIEIDAPDHPLPDALKARFAEAVRRAKGWKTL
jgi:glycerol kinase